MSLKICLVTTFYPPDNFGGDGIHVQRLAAALGRRGHRVEVVYSRDAYRALADDRAGSRPSGSDMQPPSNVRVTPIASGLGRLAPLLTHQLGVPVLERRALRKILGRPGGGNFDVLHFHNVSLIGGAGVFTLGSGVKLLTAHEYWMDCPTHMLFRYGREICTRRTCVRCTLRSGRPPQLWRYVGLMDRNVRELDLVIAPSCLAASIYQKMRYAMRTEVLPHFLPDAYRRRAIGRGARHPDAPLYCLFVGRLDPIKGLGPVVEKFAAGAFPVPLWIAGDGPQGAELRTLAGDSRWVQFLSHVEPDALGPLYRDAIAVVLPSAGQEVFGQVILEALAHGTPALVSATGAMSEIIEATGGGRVFRSAEELADLARRLATSPELRNALGEAGRNALEQTYSEGSYMDRYEEIVEQHQ